MKNKYTKIVLMISAALICQSVNAQTTSDFESFNLTAGSYLNGSSQPGGMTFTDGNAEFPNFYDPSFQYWLSGWAISNIQDSTTAGFTNMYAAAAYSGVNGSATYAIGQQNAIVSLTGAATGKVISGFYITNSTYSYISMRDGDTYAKKFGGPTGNDPDYFKLTIRNWYNGALTNDSVEFYLADYRFNDNSLDYIVTNWQWVDLTSLGNSDSILFTLSSTDVGSFGINTPLFYCIDNFTTADSPVSVADIKSSARNIFVYPNPAQNEIFIGGIAEKSMVIISDISGRVILQCNIEQGTKINISTLPAGMYIVSLVSRDGKQTVQLIKK